MATRHTDARPDTATPTDAVPSTAITSFRNLGVPDALIAAMDAQGITAPFPIQTATLPDSLAGRDVLGRGRTGSGKTLAFALPLIARLSERTVERTSRRPRALVLAPTRELAIQISDTLVPLAKACGLRTMVIIGGVNQNPQVSSLRQGVEIIVACPGRLEDLIAQGHLTLDQIEVTVLDEADHMADLGFLPAVTRILKATPSHSQRMLFSATLDKGVDSLVRRFLHDPVTHSVDSAQSPVATMEHHVLHVTNDDRLGVLVDLASAPGRTMVFTRTKQRAKQLTRSLNAQGVSTVEMHGNLSQGARVRNLAAFSDGRATALVATDIAARGIHVDDVTLVIHADPPTEHKAYLHRSGRTARAGNDGIVITLATESQQRDVASLTRKAGIRPTVTQLTTGHPLLNELAPGERVTQSPTEIAAALAVGAPVQGSRPPRAPGSSAPRRRRGNGGQGGRGASSSHSQSRGGQSAGSSSGRRRSGAARSR